MYNPRYLLLGRFLLASHVSSLIGLLSCVSADVCVAVRVGEIDP